MPSIAAVVHTLNDALRLGRALETLRACDELLVIDHGSQDATTRVAHSYGALVVNLRGPEQAGLDQLRSDWIFCLNAHESISESLEASLYEWRLDQQPCNPAACAVLVREEIAEGWFEHATPEVRLVPRNWPRWLGNLPASPVSPAQDFPLLTGHLLRFVLP